MAAAVVDHLAFLGHLVRFRLARSALDRLILFHATLVLAGRITGEQARVIGGRSQSDSPPAATQSCSGAAATADPLPTASTVAVAATSTSIPIFLIFFATSYPKLHPGSLQTVNKRRPAIHPLAERGDANDRADLRNKRNFQCLRKHG